MKKGIIEGIWGHIIVSSQRDVKIGDRVLAGSANLSGEVLRVSSDRSVIMIYEDPRGLGVSEEIIFFDKPISIKLGHGVISSITDGLQRPLNYFKKECGDFIKPVKSLIEFEPQEKEIYFQPLKKSGDLVQAGEAIGFTEEKGFKIYVFSDKSGRLERIKSKISFDEPLAYTEEGEEIFPYIDWNIKLPRPFKRKIVPHEPIITGQRIIDFLFPIPLGGTVIFPGGFGTGKTVLQQTIAKFARVDLVIYVGCGERGNEMAELIEDFEKLTDPWTGKPLLERTIMIVNTSNMPVAAREGSIYTAITLAEYYRDCGLNVLLIADSISRWAEALREISSSLEEMPGDEGYPTYLNSRIASFFERAGVVETLNGSVGSITLLISVSPPGGDLTEPVTQSALRVAGAFIFLDKELAQKRFFPAINYMLSYSLYENELAWGLKKYFGEDYFMLKNFVFQILREEDKLREIIEVVGYENLQDKDRLTMDFAELIKFKFLAQNSFTKDAFSPPEDTIKKIKKIKDLYEEAAILLSSGAAFFEVKKVYESF